MDLVEHTPSRVVDYIGLGISGIAAARYDNFTQAKHLLCHTQSRLLCRLQYSTHDLASLGSIASVIKSLELALKDLGRLAPCVGPAGLGVRLSEDGDAQVQGQQQADAPLLPEVRLGGVGEDGLDVGAGHGGGGGLV
ncbi:hypothetical protein PG993_008264 [Apiospora rasikravindrae]|uniref:Uncharacterized protein n=1 Tax=Apiospora rasikravindrae TaxID=990691 RepID=A0ABR1SZU6_9PEZI